MAYTDETRLRYTVSTAKVTELADDTKDGLADTNVVEEAIAAADEEVYSYIGGRFPTYTPASVVVATCNPRIRSAASWLAIGKLAKRRGKILEKILEAELRWLEMVRDNLNVTLTGLTTSALPDSVDRLRRREFREHGPLSHEGEPAPGVMDEGATDNDFLGT